MPNFLQFLFNPTWLSTIIGILVTIFVALVIYQLQRNRKKLAYKIISNTPIFSIHNEVSGRMKVLFDDKPVKDARIVVLKIWNSGNMPIRSDDFDKNNPVKLKFGNRISTINRSIADILDFDVLDAVPDTIKSRITLKKSQGELFLEPLLLNSKDSMTLKVVLTGSDGEVSVDARIAGVNQIRADNKFEFSGKMRVIPQILPGITFSLIVCLILTIFTYFTDKTFWNDLPQALIVLPIFFLFLNMFFNLFKSVFS
ncbi:MAG TPA: hypothetical protein VFQ36_25650, partial [Ktedonobacteraceae bacterium]|nr:hypothetical protein [Ktedonobacteraceae bacterium]